MYGPDLEAITAVLHEDEITVTIEEAVAEQRVLPGGYVVCDVFETERDIVGATLEAVNRQAARSEDEKNAAMLYHYDAEALTRVSEGGSLTATLPAPLDAETIISVFEQLAHHPAYRHQLVVGISRDIDIITMRDGTAKIVTEAPA
jgi:hypothetical protein